MRLVSLRHGASCWLAFVSPLSPPAQRLHTRPLQSVLAPLAI